MLGNTTNNAFSNYSMSRELQSTLHTFGIELPALRNHIPYMAHIILLALGAFMRRLSIKGHTKYWEARERDGHCGENECINIRKSQRLQKEGNGRINKVSAMRSGFAKIIEKVHISRYFECPETDLHIAEKACCIDYADTCSSNGVLDFPNAKVRITPLPIMHCEGTLEVDTGVALASLPITRLHPPLAPKSPLP